MNRFKKFILDFIFKISTYPVLLRDLLEANALFNEGILVDPGKLNYKIKYLNLYILYGILCIFILIPSLIITHYLFTKIDFHISIISSVFVTSCVFIFYDVFKQILKKEISKILIIKAWKNHFPCFSYEKYSKILEEIYKQAIKENIDKTNLEQYVLEKIVNYSK